jgi:23S rRNA (cytosine1962-C5)-methyltransferase
MQNQFSFYKNYELIDCGDGRRLERFGDVIVDRPAKQAFSPKKAPQDVWDNSDAVFDEGWSFKKELPEILTFDMGMAKMGLKLTTSGQIGIFPEQAFNWEWLLGLSQTLKSPISTLNCFAYTGGSSLFASYLGEVCHVDGSKASVKWASDNVRLSGFEDRSIRWIVDDVITFMKREVKRGKKYNGLILDPPAFGRGKDGKVWSLKKDMEELITLSEELTSDDLKFLILSAHDLEFGEEELKEALSGVKNIRPNCVETIKLDIPSKSGNALPCGVCARFKNC